VTVNASLFKQINNAVLDLQASGLQSYERPIKALARLLRDASLQPAVERMTEALDLEAFLEDSGKSQKSMLGSASLSWPDDPVKQLGLTYLLIQKFGEQPDELFQFGLVYFNSGSKITANIHAVTRELIIPFIRDFQAYVSEVDMPASRPAVTADSNKIFIVHGHDEGARETLARFIERLGFEPVILHEQANRGRTVIEKVEANSKVGFAVVLLTPDDIGCVKTGTPAPRARQNVLLELGYFIGLLGRDRVCTLKRGDLEFPSDFAGAVWVPMDETSGWKLALAKELQAAGYAIDMNRALS
jgi:predicted nucleotide-binding protein